MPVRSTSTWQWQRQREAGIWHMTLGWTMIPTNVKNFWRQPVLLTGERDAILIDGAFTFSIGHDLVEAIRNSGKQLRQIIVTCHDPDYYFNLGVVKAAFPEVPVLAPPGLVSKIAETVQHKIAVWRDEMGDDGPASLADLALPEPIAGNIIKLEGTEIEIVTARQPLNYHLWLPNERAILGGVQICGANHVWMADTPAIADRLAWIADLEMMLARNPAAAPPGHAPPGSPAGIEAITATRDYICAFNDELARAQSADALIAVMHKRYSGLSMEFVLDLGARVCMGEAKWP